MPNLTDDQKREIVRRALPAKADEVSTVTGIRIVDETLTALRGLLMKTPESSEKIAPVQGYTPGIPWSLHLEAYDAYRKRWGAQPALIDLEGRGCRGGFGTEELDEFIPGWRDRVSEIGRLRAEVARLEALVRATPEGSDAGASVEVSVKEKAGEWQVYLSRGVQSFPVGSVRETEEEAGQYSAMLKQALAGASGAVPDKLPPLPQAHWLPPQVPTGAANALLMTETRPMHPMAGRVQISMMLPLFTAEQMQDYARAALASVASSPAAAGVPFREELLALLREIRPMADYGRDGTRDVDQKRYQLALDGAIALLSRAGVPGTDRRAKFEAAMRKRGIDTDRVNNGWTEPYKHRDVESMWFGWQAAAELVATSAASLPTLTDKTAAMMGALSLTDEQKDELRNTHGFTGDVEEMADLIAGMLRGNFESAATPDAVSLATPDKLDAAKEPIEQECDECEGTGLDAEFPATCKCPVCGGTGKARAAIDASLHQPGVER